MLINELKRWDEPVFRECMAREPRDLGLTEEKKNRRGGEWNQEEG